MQEKKSKDAQPKQIVALPVDARPVVRAQVQLLMMTSGWALVVPPKESLGHFRVQANVEALAIWLMTEGADASAFVVSLDMLVYGGLVPSRFIDNDLVQLRARLDILKSLKAKWPEKPIYAFAATMRLSNNNINEEEKPYWDQFGELIWRWSFFSDRFAIHGAPDDEQCANHARDLIPLHIRDDYLATRERNFAVTGTTLQMVDEGIINRLVLPQDDTAEYGFNIAERRVLQVKIKERGIEDRVLIYPGADEVIHTLAAYAVSHANTTREPSSCAFYLLPSDPESIVSLVARYEDRPILESIAAQIHAVGGTIVDSAATADVILAVHTDGATQGDWAMRIPLANPQPISLQWLDQLVGHHQQGKPVALLDLAYANGGDPRLIELIAARLPLTEFAAYAGWNTASNSAGSVVAQCALAKTAFASATNQQFLCLRLLEDVFYQSMMRQDIRDAIDETSLTPDELEAQIAISFIAPANVWIRQHGFNFRVATISMPWERTFEIDITLEPIS
jgi:Protein of unknown function (DUF4127)